MSERARIIAVLLAAVLTVACNRSGDVARVVSAEGEILTIDGQYTLIVLSQDVMRQAFGSDWHRLSLFYGSNRAITQDGERSMIDSPLRPLAKGAPILVISGDDWPDLVVPVYALERRKMAIFVIDTVKGTISLRGRAELRPGEPMFSPDGHLFFR
jgi:hypothetical protein